MPDEIKANQVWVRRGKFYAVQRVYKMLVKGEAVWRVHLYAGREGDEFECTPDEFLKHSLFSAKLVKEFDNQTLAMAYCDECEGNKERAKERRATLAVRIEAANKARAARAAKQTEAKEEK